MKRNLREMRTAPIGDWLPRMYFETNDELQSVATTLDCTKIGRPALRSGDDLVWVASVDLATKKPRLGARGSGGVVTGEGLVYSSASTMYITTASNGEVNQRADGSREVFATPGKSTAIHAFDLAGENVKYLASGTVRGTLLSQFSMSEYRGVLRVASTRPKEGFGEDQESSVHMLVRKGRSLKQIGMVDGLGRNELIYAVRFIGDLGYVVTFKGIDPLYVLDLRNPRKPIVAGELKIPGYSAYLHPIAPGFFSASAKTPLNRVAP